MPRLEVWLDNIELSPNEVDCSTTVMLKILDGKCKMSLEDKVVMEALYDMVKEKKGELFDADIHRFIRHARMNRDEDLKMEIYEMRLMAETMLSRPTMKAFKARIREAGLFEAYQRAVV